MHVDPIKIAILSNNQLFQIKIYFTFYIFND